MRPEGRLLAIKSLFFGAVLERVREAAQQLGHVCMADLYKCSLREMFSDILRRVLC